jgi:galactokinase/mevalonate kinase-like predicted kinase
MVEAMIVTKTPLRISFVGGGSDRPSFYQEEPGACVAAAINKYVYVAVKPEFTGRVLAHYRATENVTHVCELKHDRMRACLESFDIQQGIEVASMADVPGSTGLGSSSSFTVGLLKALDHHVAICPPDDTDALAQEACTIEMDDCAGVMHWAWNVKRKYVGTPQIEGWYNRALAAGAWGGKLCGAGGGGFLLFLAPPERHQAIIAALGLRHLPIRVGVPGCEVVYGSL